MRVCVCAWSFLCYQLSCFIAWFGLNHSTDVNVFRCIFLSSSLFIHMILRKSLINRAFQCTAILAIWLIWVEPWMYLGIWERLHSTKSKKEKSSPLRYPFGKQIKCYCDVKRNPPKIILFADSSLCDDHLATNLSKFIWVEQMWFLPNFVTIRIIYVISVILRRTFHLHVLKTWAIQIEWNSCSCACVCG